MTFIRKIQNNKNSSREKQFLNQVRLAIFVVFLLSILTQLVDNAFILITPTLEKEFNISIVMSSWISSIAGIGIAIGFLAFSSYSDFFSERKLLWLGIFLFIFPSIIGLSLQNYFYAIFIARFIQAVGGISTAAIYLVLIARYLPANEKVIWIGLSTTSFMLSSIIGTLAGGFLTENFGWQVIFYIPFLALLAIPILWIKMPSSKNFKGKTEPFIFILLIAVVIVLNFVASMPANYILWIITIIVIGMFLLYVYKSKRLAHAKNAIFTKTMIKNKSYMFSLLATFLYFLPQVAVVFLLPFLLDSLYNMSLDEVSIMYIIPYSIAAIMGALSGKIIKKIGFEYTLLIGALLIISGFIMLGFWANKSKIVVQVFFSFIVVGYALSFNPLLNRSIAHLPAKQVGVGIGMFNFVLRTALALGISIAAFMQDSNLANLDFINFTPAEMDVFTIIFWTLASFALIGTLIHFMPLIFKKQVNHK